MKSWWKDNFVDAIHEYQKVVIPVLSKTKGYDCNSQKA